MYPGQILHHRPGPASAFAELQEQHRSDLSLEFDEEAFAVVDGESARKAWHWWQPVAAAGWRGSSPAIASFDALALQRRSYPAHAAAPSSVRPFASSHLEWFLPQISEGSFINACFCGAARSSRSYNWNKILHFLFNSSPVLVSNVLNYKYFDIGVPYFPL